MKTSKSKNLLERLSKGENVCQRLIMMNIFLRNSKISNTRRAISLHAFEEGEDVFLIGIRNIAKAQGGMKALSSATQLNRESLYDMLSKEGNPRLSSLTAVLDQLGIKLEFSVKLQGTEAA